MSRFPLSFQTALGEWWNAPPPLKAEERILSQLPFFPETDGVRHAKSERVILEGKGRSINEFSVFHAEPNSKTEQKNLVMLHGYGAGLGFYFRNFDGLSKNSSVRLHALDLLGMGNSSRPPFHPKGDDKVEWCENFFTNSLEEWRKHRGIEKMQLLGHSLGGYLAVAYALKYPEHVDQLILVSPVGIPANPYLPTQSKKDINTAEVNPPTTLQREFSESQEETISDHQDSSSEVVDKPRQIPGWLSYLWNNNYTPFLFVRNTGPFGPKLVSGWSYRRFSALTEEQKLMMHDYTYAIFKQKGSSEYALTYLLAPGAFARKPLIHRFKDLKVPTTFIYGSYDWMDENGGRSAAKIMQRNGIQADVEIVDRSGHHVYLDNPKAFNQLINNILNRK